MNRQTNRLNIDALDKTNPNFLWYIYRSTYTVELLTKVQLYKREESDIENTNSIYIKTLLSDDFTWKGGGTLPQNREATL